MASTSAFSTSALGGALLSGLSTNYVETGSTCAWQTTSREAERLERQRQAQMAQLGSLYQYRPYVGEVTLGRGAANQVEPVKQEQKGRSMVDEFRSYIREYKDWIFTIAIIAVVDHFFLDGALKDKLAAALGKKLDSGDAKA